MLASEGIVDTILVLTDIFRFFNEYLIPYANVTCLETPRCTLLEGVRVGPADLCRISNTTLTYLSHVTMCETSCHSYWCLGMMPLMGVKK